MATRSTRAAAARGWATAFPTRPRPWPPGTPGSRAWSGTSGIASINGKSGTSRTSARITRRKITRPCSSARPKSCRATRRPDLRPGPGQIPGVRRSVLESHSATGENQPDRRRYDPRLPEEPRQHLEHRQAAGVVGQVPPAAAVRQGETGAPSGETVGALRDVAWTESKQAKWDLRRMLAHHGQGVPFNLFTLCELK